MKGDECTVGRVLTERIDDMRKDFDRLEDRFYKIVVGGLSFLVLQLLTLVILLMKG